jgi:pimeloyl-ACP methyl ester carboxylesterase/DNA-binding SARP family transcriptional activator
MYLRCLLVQALSVGGDRVTVRVRVLGPVEVATTDAPVAVVGRQGAIVAILAARAGSVVSADQLVDGLWGERLPDDPSNALQGVVSRLRSRFGGGLIETQGAGYRLGVPPEEVDAQRFEELLGRGEEALASVAVGLIDEALALWRGQAFGEHADLAPLRAEASRLEELRLVASERRLRFLVVLGRLDEAIAGLEAFMVEHPFRERSLGVLMEALARAGRKTEALQRLRVYRSMLAEESGLDPSVALLDLEQAILTDGLDRPADPPTGPRAAVASSAAPLFKMRLRSFDRAPGERVAYGEVGDGAPLVFMPGWVSRLDEYSSGADPRGRLLAKLAERQRVIAYDRYGTGMSAGPVNDFSLETSVEELLRLLDAIDEEHVTLFASSCSSVVGVAAAARDSRVARVVALCGFACGPAVFHNRAVADSMLSMVRSGWGLGSRVLANLLLPGGEDEPGFARFQRQAATPEVAAGFLGQMYSADVSGLLATVLQPALIMHYREDPAIPVAGGYELARGLPNAELILLEGACHLPPEKDVNRIAEATFAFCETG